MTKRVRHFLLLLLITSPLLQPPTAASVKQSRGLMLGRHEVFIINGSSRRLGFEAMTPRGRRNCQLHAGGDVTLENVNLIRVAGTNYSLEFKNRYALLWDEQRGRAYVRRLVAGK